VIAKDKKYFKKFGLQVTEESFHFAKVMSNIAGDDQNILRIIQIGQGLKPGEVFGKIDVYVGGDPYFHIEKLYSLKNS
jgi:hypothetical protein